MTIVEHKWSTLPVPNAIEVLDRHPTQRDDDPDFYAKEAELPWPLMRQMACRPKEILNARDLSIPEVWSDDHPQWPPIVDLEP